MTGDISIYEQVNSLDELFSNSTAVLAAGMSIPTMTHRDPDHSNTSIGVGLGSYNDKLGLALGLEHHITDFAFKGTIGAPTDSNSDGIIYGAGASYGW